MKGIIKLVIRGSVVAATSLVVIALYPAQNQAAPDDNLVAPSTGQCLSTGTSHSQRFREHSRAELLETSFIPPRGKLFGVSLP